MQVCLLVGGTGTRLKEMTGLIPKALVPIGGKPMAWHIMKIYAHYGFKDFVLALGYKQDSFKEYFAHFDEINNDVLFTRGSKLYPSEERYFTDNWNVLLSDTGVNTMKGARLKRIEKYIQGDTFMATYGDGVSDVNIPNVLAFHKSHGKIATITGVHPTPRFGEIHHDNGRVLSFTEKNENDGCLMNGGFMVFNRGIFDYLSADESCDLETTVFEALTADKELMVHHHKGFWACCDTMKDMGELQHMWDSGEPKWKIWK